jgi:hypothetical protein
MAAALAGREPLLKIRLTHLAPASAAALKSNGRLVHGSRRQGGRGRAHHPISSNAVAGRSGAVAAGCEVDRGSGAVRGTEGSSSSSSGGSILALTLLHAVQGMWSVH